MTNRKHFRGRACLAERLERRLLLAAGDLDPTFGLGGLAVTHAANATFTTIAVQQDGKILRGGTYQRAAGDSDFVLERYNLDGGPDLSFGSAGRVITDFAEQNDFLSDVRVLSNGT